MKSNVALWPSKVFVIVFAASALFLSCWFASAQNVQLLSVTQAGGMPGMPLVTGVLVTTNHVTVTWDGPSGYYQLFQKKLTDTKWQAVGGPTNLARRATLVSSNASMLFKVRGPAPQYSGAQVCTECHQGIHDAEIGTRHAQAFAALKQIHQDKNPSCLPCHTAGYKLTTGFISETATPQLAGVQCENCHGPAGNHAANPDDVSVRPRVELAATVCGGCHTGSQQPAYDEWKTSE